ncbi:MAG: MBL fold metallo-hydrolase [Xanthomonadales bacterium]|nr:MBL fold metallo-hydrolase [Xanthomonadales bacterium]
MLRTISILILLLASAPVTGDADARMAGDYEETRVTKSVPYHHVPGRGFRNLPGSPRRSAAGGEMSKVARELLASKAVVVPENHVMPRHQALKGMETASNPSVTWLGHAAFIVRIAGKSILTDPFIGKTAGPVGIGPKRFVASPLAADELPRADVMVVSHDHYDHLDAHAIDKYRFKDSTQVIVPLGLGPFFLKRGYTRVLEQDWWQSWEQDGLSVTTLPAVHFSGRRLFDRNKTLWASFAFESADERIWFSGDTATGEVFKEIGQRHGPFDLALVAIGAYEPRSMMRSIHASPEEAIEIARTIGARQAIGMHWGTIRLTPEQAFEPPVRFRQAAMDQGYGADNAIILKIGETFELSHHERAGAQAL